MEAGDATVEDSLGVVHLAVAHEMDEVGRHAPILRRRVL
jgi:hypothetical protein